jgi:hypothetical protein
MLSLEELIEEAHIKSKCWKECYFTTCGQSYKTFKAVSYDFS